MAWVKGTDTFNVHQSWMDAAAIAAERGDDRLVSELRGVAYALYSQSAVTYSDYIVGFGEIALHAGLTRAEPVLIDLMKIGILTDISTADTRKYKLLEDPEFIGLIKSNERLMRKKRDRDRNRGTLIVPVLLRDGDFCRYCGNEVRWESKNTGDRGTFDHREPEAETTIDNLVVSCWDCNQARTETADPDSDLPLLPPPEDLTTFSKWIMDKFKKWNRITERTTQQLGVPNPLTATSGRYTPAPATSRATATNPQSTPPSGTTDSQSERSPQIPADSRKVESQDSHTVESTGRAAQEAQPRRASSSATFFDPAHTEFPEPPALHVDPVPQADQAEHVRSARPANEANDPARRRRRRPRRR